MLTDLLSKAIMWVGVVLSIAFVAIRTHVQYRNTRKFFINDHFIFIALVLHIASAIIYQVALPLMYELSSVSLKLSAPTAGFPERMSIFLKLQFTVDFTLWTTLWAVKFSLLFFFWRLFDSVKSHMRIFWWIMVAITAINWVIIVILAFLACDPIMNFFTLGTFLLLDVLSYKLMPLGTCSTKRDIFYSNLIFQFVSGTDIAGDLLSEHPTHYNFP